MTTIGTSKMEVRSTKLDKTETMSGYSEIVRMYEGKTIFLTGATGYMGKMLLEKLLRSCPAIKKIYLLVRSKKGKDITTRFNEIFSGPIWEPLKKQNTNFMEKVDLIGGDLILPYLGLSDESISTLKDTVEIIFHCAATIRFDQHIKSAAYMNVRSVKDLMEISKDMKNLQVLVYVSTAYSHSTRKVIEEKFYEPPLSCKNLLSLVESLSDEKLAEITPTLIGEWPNTYTYTKAIAESVIEEGCESLPVVVCRPSIVTAAVSEPLPGWIDNLYGPSGVFLACALGVMRCLRGDESNNADMVPADYAINSVIAVAAEKCKKKAVLDPKEKSIFNYCNSPQAPITWRSYTDLSMQAGMEVPSTHCMWVGLAPIRKNIIHHTLAVFFLHTIPAYLIDFFLLLTGQKLQGVKGYAKINKFSNVLSYFVMREWDFKMDNTMELWKTLNEEDKKLFPFSMENFNWGEYIRTYVRGIRVYLLKDPLETIPAGMKKMRKLKLAHNTLIFVLSVLILLLIRFIVSYFW